MSILILVLVLTIQELTLAAPPLKCLLDQSFLFSNTKFPASFYNDYNVRTIELDPIRVGSVTFDEDDVKIMVKDLEFSGFRDAIIDEFSVNFNTNLTRIVFTADVTAKCTYMISGYLFSIPVNGEGPFSGLFKNFKIEMAMPFEVITDENGRKYANLKKYYSWHDFSGNGFIKFGNIYNGNKHRSEVMHSMISQNLRIFALRFGTPFYGKMVSQIFHVFKDLMLTMPIRDYSTC